MIIYFSVYSVNNNCQERYYFRTTFRELTKVSSFPTPAASGKKSVPDAIRNKSVRTFVSEKKAVKNTFHSFHLFI